MSYHIDYVSSGKQQKNPVRKRPWIFTLTLLLVFVFLVNNCWSRGQEILQELLWPGDPETTQQALETFVTQLRYGEPMKDAIELFCLEILENESIR